MRASQSGGGEAKLRDKNRRRRWLFGALFASGFIPGVILGFSEAEGLLSPDNVWPAELVIALSAIFLIAVGSGAVLLNRQMDEVERLQHYKAAGLASSVLVVVYPIWWLLWMGALVPEPIHWVLFLLFYLTFILGLIFYRLR